MSSREPPKEGASEQDEKGSGDADVFDFAFSKFQNFCTMAGIDIVTPDSIRGPESGFLRPQE
jgi:hypothetical protein